MPRQTIARIVELQGTGLHTGAATRVTLSPALSGSGIRFRRTDLQDAIVPARVAQVQATERRTALAEGKAGIDTVEHLLAAAHALGLDDLDIGVDGPELPIFDGSFEAWFDGLASAGTQELAGERAVVRVTTPFTVDEGGARYIVAPGSGLQITATIEWDHPLIGRQSGSFTITGDTFRTQIARARTFGFVHEVEGLQQRGLLKGATPEMAVVLSDTGLASGTLHWNDEFVRHKIGDIVGDLALLGARIDAHIVAERPSHQGNLALARALARLATRTDATRIDINNIMRVLPHRFPFLLVDRIVEVESGRRIVGIKNVTINEPFFVGHFPGHPIMPGVLIVEAMAQVGGMLVMSDFEAPETKVVYFTGVDGVRFRKPVLPGDQLRFEVEVLQIRGTICRMRGKAYVEGQLVCEAEMMATVRDR